MTKEQVGQLFTEGIIPGKQEDKRSFIETHISWVILAGDYAYKIKRPVHYSFLDFSTLEKREYFCHRELQLNRRLTEGIYLDVQPVNMVDGHLSIGGGEGLPIDHAVRMKKMDRNKQMDQLLRRNNVTQEDILRLAEKITAFHQRTETIAKRDYMDVQEKFDDLGEEADFIGETIDAKTGQLIRRALEVSDRYLESARNLLASRASRGYFRDCHGDLHSRNIFIDGVPQPFDCIEFNDDFRQIDVLNEVAFLCMDLEAFGRQDLAASFLQYYTAWCDAMASPAEEKLFVYYKAYRANIRAKVNSLRARSAQGEDELTLALSETGRYLKLMNNYLESL